MRPYAQLSEAAKELDRGTVRAVLDALRSGEDMVKLLVETVEEAGGKITFDPKRTNRRPECPHGVGLCTSSCPSKAPVAPTALSREALASARLDGETVVIEPVATTAEGEPVCSSCWAIPGQGHDMDCNANRRESPPESDADGEKPWTPAPGDRIRNYLSPTDLGTVQTCEPAFSQFGVPVIWDKSPGALFYVSIAQLVRVEPQSPPSANNVPTVDEIVWYQGQRSRVTMIKGDTVMGPPTACIEPAPFTGWVPVSALAKGDDVLTRVELVAALETSGNEAMKWLARELRK